MEMNKNIDIIISKYKEDLSWVDKLKDNKSINNVFIYNKDIEHQDDLQINLPNIGREAHTYLYHIVHNYEKLNEINIFLQGNPFDHSKNLFWHINQLKTNNIKIYPFNKITIEDKYSIHRNHKIHPNGLYISYFMDFLFDHKLDINENILVNYGAQFACAKKNIINRPKDFYRFLLKFASYEQNPIEAYIFERLWLYIFDSNISLNNKYKLWI